uniref:Uncharacterized protein n=1 Tax=Meloidogyne enterolobii TaxID=390850 RepID=A0A6V7VPC3_MELEN|nr:unnamed protein product [Meloidogyne enterolobii]
MEMRAIQKKKKNMSNKIKVKGLLKIVFGLFLLQKEQKLKSNTSFSQKQHNNLCATKLRIII